MFVYRELYINKQNQICFPLFESLGEYNNMVYIK